MHACKLKTYLNSTLAMQGLKWAMAGRNKAKLEEMRASLARPGQDLSDVSLLEADVNNPASLNALAASTSVVITMVGPYALYGRPVVQVRSRRRKV
jgi:short subunit dehydrogenase-like uncharacterized protein